MLIEFSVENFLSFKDRVTFSMVASEDDAHPDNTIDCPDLPEEFGSKKLLKTAALFGPNASGKSNLLKAMYFLRKSILENESLAKGKNFSLYTKSSSSAYKYAPSLHDEIYFKLDALCAQKPTIFEVVFLHNAQFFKYQIKLKSTHVLEESLKLLGSEREEENLIFGREALKIISMLPDPESSKFDTELLGKLNSHIEGILPGQNNTTNIGELLSEIRKEDLEKKLRKTTILLSKAAYDNYALAEEVLEWFQEDFLPFEIIPDDLFSREMNTDLLRQLHKKNNHFSSEILNALSNADFSISTLKAQERKREYKGFDGGVENSVVFYRDSSNKAEVVPFELFEESLGTQRFFILIGHILNVLKVGSILLLDEIEHNLHPKLVEYIINLFHDPEINKNNAQLIFTTHNTQLLDLNMFRKDQIWFTDRKSDGATELFSLAEFDILDEDKRHIRRDYLWGVFGAVPRIVDGF